MYSFIFIQNNHQFCFCLIEIIFVLSIVLFEFIKIKIKSIGFNFIINKIIQIIQNKVKIDNKKKNAKLSILVNQNLY